MKKSEGKLSKRQVITTFAGNTVKKSENEKTLGICSQFDATNNERYNQVELIIIQVW